MKKQDMFFTLSMILMLMDCVATIAARLPQAEREQVLKTLRSRRGRIARLDHPSIPRKHVSDVQGASVRVLERLVERIEAETRDDDAGLPTASIWDEWEDLILEKRPKKG